MWCCCCGWRGLWVKHAIQTQHAFAMCLGLFQTEPINNVRSTLCLVNAIILFICCCSCCVRGVCSASATSNSYGSEFIKKRTGRSTSHMEHDHRIAIYTYVSHTHLPSRRDLHAHNMLMRGCGCGDVYDCLNLNLRQLRKCVPFAAFFSKRPMFMRAIWWDVVYGVKMRVQLNHIYTHSALTSCLRLYIYAFMQREYVRAEYVQCRVFVCVSMCISILQIKIIY